MANMVVLVGRVTRDPEVKNLGDGKMVTRYSLAVNRTYKRDGDPDADFFNCVTFNKQAEFASKYLTKGKKILIRGELRNNDYTNKDGQKVRNVEIVVAEHEFMESKSSESSSPANTSTDGFMDVSAMDITELPFS